MERKDKNMWVKCCECKTWFQLSKTPLLELFYTTCPSCESSLEVEVNTYKRKDQNQ
jgi:hypothetical protein